MNDSESETSQADIDRGLSTLKEIVAALSLAVGGLSSAQATENLEEVDFYEAVRLCEVRLIERALKRTKGNQAQAARILNLKQTTLHGKIKKYRIAPSVLLFGDDASVTEQRVQIPFEKRWKALAGNNAEAAGVVGQLGSSLD